MAGFLRQLWQWVRPHQSRWWLGMLAGIAYGLSNGLLILVVKITCDVLFPSEKSPPLARELAQLKTFAPGLHDSVTHWLEGITARTSGAALWIFISLVPLTMMIRGLGFFLSNYEMWWVSTRIVHDLRVRLFAHIQRLSLDFFSASRTGDLLSRLLNDIQALQTLLVHIFTTMVKEPLTLVTIAGYLLWQQRRLTLVTLIVFPLCLVPILVYGRKVRKSWRAAQTHTAELSDVMQETFTGHRIIQAYNLEGTMTEKFVATSRRITSQFMRFIRAQEMPGPLIEFFGAIGVALLFAYIARESVRATTPMTSGDFVAFVGSLFMLYQPVKNLGRLWTQLEQARATNHRLEELLIAQSKIVEPAKPRPLQAAGADIEFAGIEFAYDSKPVLADIKLCVKAGQMAALVGASGSGKTTLTNLLLRFYDPQRGCVRIGNIDVREVSTYDLRRQIAVVTQDTVLFNDTVRANIRFGRLGASDADVEAAARHAFAHEFIAAEPHGYDTMVGEKGARLSGGQKQRIAIARALLKNAPILVLDEATSSLDTESERAVQAALDELMRGRTTICIAHRLSTVQRADVIAVFERGRIVETGSHAELLARSGLYKRLHDLQFAD